MAATREDTMTNPNHQIVRDYFAAMSRGVLPDELFTDDLSVWTTTSGIVSPKPKYEAGLKMLQSLFPAGLTYTVNSITAEEDRAAAEVRGQGTLSNGDTYDNSYVFMFRFRDGRIASIAEHFNALIVHEKIVPLVKQAMAQASQ